MHSVLGSLGVLAIALRGAWLLALDCVRWGRLCGGRLTTWAKSRPGSNAPKVR